MWADACKILLQKKRCLLVLLWGGACALARLFVQGVVNEIALPLVAADDASDERSRVNAVQENGSVLALGIVEVTLRN